MSFSRERRCTPTATRSRLPLATAYKPAALDALRRCRHAQRRGAVAVNSSGAHRQRSIAAVAAGGGRGAGVISRGVRMVLIRACILYSSTYYSWYSEIYE